MCISERNSSTFWKRAIASCILALSCATAPAFADIGLTGFWYTHSSGYNEWLVYDNVLGVTWKGNTGSSGDIGWTSYVVATGTWAERPAGSWHMGTLDYVDSVHDRICGAENTYCTVWSTAFSTWASNLEGFLGPPYPYPPVNGDWVYNFTTGVGFVQWGANKSAMSYYNGNLMNPAPAPVPLPGALVMFLGGLMGLGAITRRRG